VLQPPPKRPSYVLTLFKEAGVAAAHTAIPFPSALDRTYRLCFEIGTSHDR
jgi:hypothetical protein